MKKICIVLPQGLPVPAVKGGAIETLIEQIILENEKTQDFLFTIICVNDSKAKQIAENYNYTKFINIGPFKDNKIFKMKSILFRAINKMFKIRIPLLNEYDKCVEEYIINNKCEFDLVINESSNFYAFKKISDIIGKDRLIAHLHCYVKADKYLDSTYGSVIVVSEYIKSRWLETSKMNKDRVIVLKNGIDINKFNKKICDAEKNRIRQELKIKHDDFVILYCGRIVPEKGIKELMQSVIKINNSKLKLLIIGSPKFGANESSKYLSEVKEIVDNNSERIIFTGFVHNEQLFKYYSISNISVIPSTYEDPGPLVPIECMAAGKVSIVTNSGGVWEYVTEECAVKVIKENNLVDELVQKILYLMQNPEVVSRMEDNAIKISRQHNSHNFFENFRKIINKFLS